MTLRVLPALSSFLDTNFADYEHGVFGGDDVEGGIEIPESWPISELHS